MVKEVISENLGSYENRFISKNSKFCYHTDATTQHENVHKRRTYLFKLSLSLILILLNENVCLTAVNARLENASCVSAWELVNDAIIAVVNRWNTMNEKTRSLSHVLGVIVRPHNFIKNEEPSLTMFNYSFHRNKAASARIKDIS